MPTQAEHALLLKKLLPEGPAWNTSEQTDGTSAFDLCPYCKAGRQLPHVQAWAYRYRPILLSWVQPWPCRGLSGSTYTAALWDTLHIILPP